MLPPPLWCIFAHFFPGDPCRLLDFWSRIYHSYNLTSLRDCNKQNIFWSLSWGLSSSFWVAKRQRTLFVVLPRQFFRHCRRRGTATLTFNVATLGTSSVLGSHGVPWQTTRARQPFKLWPLKETRPLSLSHLYSKPRKHVGWEVWLWPIEKILDSKDLGARWRGAAAAHWGKMQSHVEENPG